MTTYVSATTTSFEQLENVKRVTRDIGAPLLVIDLPTIAERFGDLSRLLPGFQVHYAVKANDERAILGLLKDVGASFEISSTRELQRLTSLDVSPSHIVSSHPVKSPSFIKAAWEAGVSSFAFDSTDEVDKLAALAPRSKVYLRISVPNHGSEWPLTRKFGVTEEAAGKHLAYAQSKGLQVCGLAFHPGSQNVEPSAWVAAIEVASRVWEAAEARGIELSVLNIGGGLPIPYDRDLPPLAEFTSVIQRTISRLFPAGITLVTEPGRFLVGEAGVLASSVVGKAHREGEPWLYLDVGVFNGLMEAVGGIRYPLVAERQGPCGKWVLAGPSCDSVDVITSDALLPELEVGDLVLFLSAGAYTTVYGSSFNGFDPPAVHFLRY